MGVFLVLLPLFGSDFFIDFVMIEKLITPVNKASFVSKNADGFF